MAPPPSKILLDKGVVRRIYQAYFRRAHQIPITPSQYEAIRVFARSRSRGRRVFITRQSANVLLLRPRQFAILILSRIGILQKGRYLSRWARRLRSFGFSPEDGVVIAYASFGLTSTPFPAELARIDTLVTNDFKLANNFRSQQAGIANRFNHMVSNLPEPYANLKLPEVLTTTAVLKLK